MYTHSGLELNYNLFHAGLSGDQWIHHDQIAKTSLLDVGGGTSLAVTPSWQMFLCRTPIDHWFVLVPRPGKGMRRSTEHPRYGVTCGGSLPSTPG
jgi:hypothetical protein